MLSQNSIVLFQNIFYNRLMVEISTQFILFTELII